MARKALYFSFCALAAVGFLMRNIQPGILLQNLGIAGCFALLLIELFSAVRRKRLSSDEDTETGTTSAPQELAAPAENGSQTNQVSWKVFWMLYSLTIAANGLAMLERKNVGLAIASIIIAGASLLAALQCIYRGVVVGRKAVVSRSESPTLFWVPVTLFLSVYLVMSFAPWY